MANTNFTPQEIEDFLQQFFDVVGARQYVGARYVPIFGRAGSDTVEWDDGAPYEPLTVVMHQGVSYVSRRYVPTGIQVTDTDYWVETYRFNAQVEQYRQEVLQFQGQIDQIRETMEADYVPFPDPDSYPKYGLLGQVLSTLANGATEWVDPVTVTADVAEPLIEDWLEAHPEATTTVQDGSITDAKLNDDSSIVRFRGAVPGTVTALSDVLNGGIYNVGAAVVQTLTDKPTGAPNASMLLLNLTYATPYGNQYPVQVAVSLYGTLMMWWRVVGSESSTDWMTLYPLSVGTSDIVDGSITDPKLADASTVVRNRGTVDASVTSIASVTSPGTYYIPQAVFAAMTDKPTGAGNNTFTLVNVPYLVSGGATYVYQILFIGHDSLNELYMRYTGAGGASAWVNLRNPVILDGSITDPKLADVSTVVRYRGRVEATVTSIASVTSPGTYYIPQAVFAAMTDKPTGAGNNTFTLVNVPYLVSGANTFVYQILFIGHDSLNELYMRFTNYNGVTAWVNLRNPVIPNNTVTPAKLTFSPNVLTGKKLVTAGDSYTAALFGSTSPDTGHNFGYWIAQRNAMTFVNSGISGSTMALSKSYVDDPDNVDIDTNHPFSYQRYLQVPSDTDYLTLWFGINDTYATYLGTIDDADNTTFYGAWNKVLEYYLTNRPYMHVGIVVTVNAGSSYTQAVRDVAAKWGYPVLDLVNGTDTPAFFEREGMSTAARDLRRDAYGWNTWNQHPNVQWHQFISSSFEEFLKRC